MYSEHVQGPQVNGSDYEKTRTHLLGEMYLRGTTGSSVMQQIAKEFVNVMQIVSRQYTVMATSDENAARRKINVLSRQFYVNKGIGS